MRKYIPGYEGMYSIDEYGSILNVRTQTVLKNIKNNGYLYIGLRKNGVTNRFSVHRIVGKLFVPNPDNLPLILHIDNDGYNCRCDNLRWGASKENSKQRDAEGRANNHIKKYNPYLGKKGSECHNSKEFYQYSLDGKLIKRFPCSYIAGEELGISRGNISSCLVGKRKTAGGFIFSYLPPNPSSNTDS